VVYGGYADSSVGTVLVTRPKSDISTTTKGPNPQQPVKHSIPTQNSTNTGPRAPSIAKQEVRKEIPYFALTPLSNDGDPDQSMGKQESGGHAYSARGGDIYTQEGVGKMCDINVTQARKRLPSTMMPLATNSRGALTMPANHSQAATQPSASKVVKKVSPAKASNRPGPASRVTTIRTAGLSKPSLSPTLQTLGKHTRSSRSDQKTKKLQMVVVDDGADDEELGPCPT
jgi:hypothetical protein